MPSGPRPSSGRCSSRCPPGARTRAPRTGPAPKRPEVLITTAATGDGVPELLAALDRHRVAGHAAAAGEGANGARLARADAQVRAVLAERVADRLRDPALAVEAAATLREVADHELDPFAAADRLLAAIGREGPR